MTITPTLIFLSAISKASLLLLHKIILTHKITVKEKFIFCSNKVKPAHNGHDISFEKILLMGNSPL